MSISPISKKRPPDELLESPSAKRQKTTDTRLKVAAKFNDIPDEILKSICEKYLNWPEDAENAAHTCKDLNRAVKFWHSKWVNALSAKIQGEKFFSIDLQKTMDFVGFNIIPNILAKQCLPGPQKIKLPNIRTIMTFDYCAGMMVEMHMTFKGKPNIKEVAKGLVFNASDLTGCLVHKIKKDNLQKDYGLFLKVELLRQIKYTFSIANRQYFPNAFAIYEDASEIVIFQENIGNMSFEIFRSKKVEIPIEKRFKLANCVVNGLALLHHESITHRNLDPQNLFVSSSFERAYISGFRSIYKTTTDQNGDEVIRAGKKLVTNHDFLPPEFIKAYVDAEDEGDLDDNAYPLLGDQASDIWQLGINLAYLFVGDFCGIDLNGIKKVEYLPRLEEWKKWHFESSRRNKDPLGHLILTMLSENPEDRPDIGAVSSALIEIAREKCEVNLKPVVFDDPDADEINDVPDADEIATSDTDADEEAEDGLEMETL